MKDAPGGDQILDVAIHECRAVVNVYTVSAHDKVTVYLNLMADALRLFCVRGEKRDVLALIDSLTQTLKDDVEDMYK